MFNDMVDGVKDRQFASLDLPSVQQVFGREAGQDGVNSGQSFAQGPEQVLGWGRNAIRELGVTVSVIRVAAHTADQPLLDVTPQMQEQVPNGVFGFVTAIPQLFRCQLSDASFDLLEFLFQFGARYGNEFGRERVHLGRVHDGADYNAPPKHQVLWPADPLGPAPST